RKRSEETPAPETLRPEVEPARVADPTPEQLVALAEEHGQRERVLADFMRTANDEERLYLLARQRGLKVAEALREAGVPGRFSLPQSVARKLQRRLRSA